MYPSRFARPLLLTACITIAAPPALRAERAAAKAPGLTPPVMEELSGAWSALEAELRRFCRTRTLSPHAGH